MLRRIGPLPVLGARRFVLTGPSLAPGISHSAGFSRYPSFVATAVVLDAELLTTNVRHFPMLAELVAAY